ncbi:GTP 3',8-cyclase MoaA [Rhodoferax sp. 4810]|uniref:GTP 3',8-cyclase n=1 Tax=Thiospirillum jenense TaxID=1653858 RepID=A0A839HCP4_9GAMM|nr:GTP 3',8-cyclase MoaA [Thiospirillum jenense]MBB1073091.1 GTP 3',8-cyclase MoaA [Rhodoferax jenense]MBB1125038.1 GTP 3',8-cyclase MoaA [Thiospirillum jenense]
MTTQLVDSFGRHINYVRLSVTDRCDLRCVYCMSNTVQFLPRDQLLTLEELVRLGRCFTALGVRHFRITGGEPLLRRNVLWLIAQLNTLGSDHQLTLTTNGTQLARHALALKAAGIARINISLDSLQPARFRQLTRCGDLNQVIAGIDAALAAGFQRIKLNSVIVADYNTDEVFDLAAFAIARGLDLSFIEKMPLGAELMERNETANESALDYYPSATIRNRLIQQFELLPTTETTSGPARYWRVAGTQTRIGFISPRSHNFCERCNRMRVTATGQLLPCLGQRDLGIDLRAILRANPNDDAPILHAICAAVAMKPKAHGFDTGNQQPPELSETAPPICTMNRIGG